MRSATHRSVLLIGLGAGSLARFIHHHLPDAVCTVVEIAPEVHAVARQFFRLPDESARFRVVIGDGARYVMNADAHWDLIAVDGFDRHARAGDLATLPFYQACWTRLSERGLMAVNLFSGQRGFKGRQDAIREAFDGRPAARQSAGFDSSQSGCNRGQKCNRKFPGHAHKRNSLLMASHCAAHLAGSSLPTRGRSAMRGGWATRPWRVSRSGRAEGVAHCGLRIQSRQ